MSESEGTITVCLPAGCPRTVAAYCNRACKELESVGWKISFEPKKSFIVYHPGPPRYQKPDPEKIARTKETRAQQRKQNKDVQKRLRRNLRE